MRRPVFAANWKMNLGPTDARAFIAAFTARWTPPSSTTTVQAPQSPSAQPSLVPVRASVVRR